MEARKIFSLYKAYNKDVYRLALHLLANSVQKTVESAMFLRDWA
jgi:hypothetical protein